MKLIRAFLPLLILPAIRAAEPVLPELLSEGDPITGLVVHLHATDGSLSVQLARTHPVVVLALSRPGHIERVRSAVTAAGVLGQVSVVAHDRGSLPLIDGTAALVIADPGAAPESELKRVLRPRGRLVLPGRPAWTKPVPESHDDWGQYFHDGSADDRSDDTAVRPVAGLQWQAGAHAMDHYRGTSERTGLRIADGILLHPGADRLTARDAFSGLPVWERGDLAVPDKLRYAFLADAELGKVFLLPEWQDRDKTRGWVAPWIHVLDLHTGKSLGELDQGLQLAPSDPEHPAHHAAVKAQAARAREDAEHTQLRLTDGKLAMIANHRLVVVDARTGERLWAAETDPARGFWIPVAAEGRLYAVVGAAQRSMAYTHWPMGHVEEVVAWDLATGEEAWRVRPEVGDETFDAYNMTLHRGRLALCGRHRKKVKNGNTRLLVLDGETGRQLNYFRPPGKGAVGFGHSHVRVIGSGDHWLINQIRFAGIVPVEAPEDEAKWFTDYTGMRPVSCTVWRATPNYLIGGASMVRLDDKEVFHNNASRTACDIGSFPASGLLFQGENRCMCQPYLTNLNALHGQSWAAEADEDRLTRGPAEPAPARDEPEVGWPQYQATPWRGATVDAVLGRDPLRVRWQHREALPAAHPAIEAEWEGFFVAQSPTLTGVSVAEGLAVYAVVQRHQVVARDAETGEERWRVLLDGRIDSQPTIHRGLVLVGTRAGTVHALNRDTGERVWTFLAAPGRRMLVANGQLESVWPAFGCVTLIERGAFVAAGRHTDLDGGIRWWILDPRTGAVRHRGVYRRRGTEPKVREQVAGINMPPVTDGRYFFHSSRWYEFEDGDMATWTITNDTIADTIDGQRELWRRTWYMPLVRPGRMSTLSPGFPGGGYKKDMWAGSYGRQFAYTPGESDYLILGGSTTGMMLGRGGGTTSSVARMRKLDRLVQHPERRHALIGAEAVWEHEFPRELNNKNFGIRTLAACADTVAVGYTWKRTNRASRMEHHDFVRTIDHASGELRQELPVPGAPVGGGISLSAHGMHVACEDGSVLYLAP